MPFVSHPSSIFCRSSPPHSDSEPRGKGTVEKPEALARSFFTSSFGPVEDEGFRMIVISRSNRQLYIHDIEFR